MQGESSLVSIPTFHMGMEIISEAFRHEMEGVTNNFFWDYRAGEGHLFLKPRDILEKRKKFLLWL